MYIHVVLQNYFTFSVVEVEIWVGLELEEGLRVDLGLGQHIL